MSAVLPANLNGSNEFERLKSREAARDPEEACVVLIAAPKLAVVF
jgi:hypothetical protein